MTAKSPNQRKAAERERHRALGRTPVQLWVAPKDREALRRYADRLNRRRSPSS